MERRGAEPLGHSLRAQPAEGKGRQTDQHHLGEVLGDQGGLADAKGHQYAHLLTAVVHPQQQHETEHEHRRDGHADQGAAHHGAHAAGGMQHARRILVVACDLIVVPIHREFLRGIHGLLHVNALGQHEGGVLVYFLAVLVLVQVACGIQIGVDGVGGEFRSAGYLSGAVALEYAHDGGLDGRRRM